ncbi:MAG: hypothetical protein ABWX67_07335 [Allosphingosinicella sp.]
MRRRGHSIWACSALALAGAADAAETVTYSYDSLGRLVRVEHGGSVNAGARADYAYDSADNRTRVTVSGVPTVAGGGFEAPEVGAGYQYRPGSGPAVFTGGSGVAGNNSVWGFAAAPEGDQLAFLQGGEAPATISLPVTGLTPGASYKVSFRLSARPGYWGMPVSLSFNGAALGTFDPPTTAFTAFTSPAFTAGSSSGILVFSASGIVHQNSGLDLVTIAAAGSN